MKKGLLFFLSMVMAFSIWGAFGAADSYAAAKTKEQIYLDRAHDLQWSLFNGRKSTKAQIYATMEKGFTTGFTHLFFRYHFKKAGLNSKGEQLYAVPAYDDMSFTQTGFCWNKKCLKGKQKYPSVKYITKGSDLFVTITQYQYNELSGNHVYTVKMIKKKNSKEPLRVYSIQRKYD
ncbi:hypothetical protein ACFFJY_18745 [Fictibacillus aquaticus]|uniref:DUF3889 domain-containing protein n=1 Tax=Fictibacillus aquaticus TaxID=2021314 RepID=A0A235F5P7_9BACL|nr:hypothetical protein [Fictibacillus aquaticus]OYD56423.1 hypothetical protein CGZ90_15520 [Fictibacillus aquaticus]